MDAITLILTALSKGAVSGLKASTSSAVQDAYKSLRTQAKKCLANRKKNEDGEVLLAQHESNPEIWGPALASQLRLVGADRDSELLAMAKMLMRLIDDSGSRAGMYDIDVRNAQVGNNNTQFNFSNNRPAGYAAIHLDNCDESDVDSNDIAGYPVAIEVTRSRKTRITENKIR
jgi:hypothetical protein